MKPKLLWASALAALFLAAHLAFLPSTLEDIDSLNFALGLHEFNPTKHQPHPPGYPVFMALGKISRAIIPSDATALAILGDHAYNFLLAVNHWYNLWRRKFGYPYWSLSAYLKHRVKDAVKFISDFEIAMAEEAKAGFVRIFTLERSPSVFSTNQPLRVAVYGSEIKTKGRGVGLWSTGYHGTLVAAGAEPVFLKPNCGGRSRLQTEFPSLLLRHHTLILGRIFSMNIPAIVCRPGRLVQSKKS